MSDTTDPAALTLALEPAAGTALAADAAADFGPEPTPTAELPDPVAATARIAQAIVDVLIGQRPVTQIAACTSNAVRARIATLVDPGLRTSAQRRPVQRVVSVRVTLPAAGVVEASAVVRGVRRSQAMALRLEGLDGRWRCTALRLA